MGAPVRPRPIARQTLCQQPRSCLLGPAGGYSVLPAPETTTMCTSRKARAQLFQGAAVANGSSSKLSTGDSCCSASSYWPVSSVPAAATARCRLLDMHSTISSTTCCTLCWSSGQNRGLLAFCYGNVYQQRCSVFTSL